MALNKTKSKKFSWGFATNLNGGVYNALRKSVLRTILIINTVKNREIIN